mgnify:FL=1
MASKRSIAELNGKWAALFQMSLVIAPLVVGVIVSMLGWLSYEVINTSAELRLLTTQAVGFDIRQRIILIHLAQIEAAIRERDPTLLNISPSQQTHLQPSGR